MNPLSLPIHVIEGEPLVLDTDLAEELEMARPTNIRSDIIEPNRAELEMHGSICRRRLQNAGPGRPAMAYYLNEHQAVDVALLSRTPKARLIRVGITRLFVAWRHGELQPKQRAVPKTYAEALRLAAETEEERLRLEQKVEEDAPKVAAWDMFLSSDGSISSRSLVQALGFRSPQQMHGLMQEAGFIYPEKDRYGRTKWWNIRAEYATAGYHRVRESAHNGTISHQLRWTPKGADWIATLLSPEVD